MKLSFFVFTWASLQSCTPLIHSVGGNFSRPASQFKSHASAEAQSLVQQAFADLNGNFIDYHLHLVGTGANDSGITIHPHSFSWWHPQRWVRTKVYMSASGVSDRHEADRQYLERLEELTKGFPLGSQFYVLALDKHYDGDGQAITELTEFSVPNAYTLKASQQFESFHPVVSIHPYRKDAFQALKKVHQQGARFIKWLPNAMGIDPADKRLIPFYMKMKEYGMVLLTHGGEEQAVEAEESQELGNPLRLRLPLNLGVKVIIAHCASLGKGQDLDDPQKKLVSNFDLFLRLMDEKKYVGLLYGELSAVTFFNRKDHPIKTLLKRKGLHPRLVNGSDYPLPAVNFIVRTSELQDYGLMTENEAKLLNEIYDYNPLLFDYVLKRTLKHPETGERFSPGIFTRKL